MYLALFNNTYKRQFEITISAKAFNKILKRHHNNFAEAAELIFTHFYRKKTTTSPKKHRAFKDFIKYNIQVLGIESHIVMAKSKQDYMKAKMKGRGIGGGGIRIINLGQGEFRAKRR